MLKNPIYSQSDDVDWVWLKSCIIYFPFFPFFPRLIHFLGEKLVVNILTRWVGHMDNCLTHLAFTFQNHLFFHKLSLIWEFWEVVNEALLLDKLLKDRDVVPRTIVVEFGQLI